MDLPAGMEDTQIHPIIFWEMESNQNSTLILLIELLNQLINLITTIIPEIYYNMIGSLVLLLNYGEFFGIGNNGFNL